MLRIWRCNCALCVIGNEFPCRPTTQSLRHPLTRVHHIAQRIKTARRFTTTPPDDKIFSWQKTASNLPKRFCMVGTRYFASAPND